MKIKICWFVLLVIEFCFAIPAYSSAKDVVIIHSYSDQSPWVKGINNSFENTLSKLGYEIIIHSLSFHVDGIMRENPNSFQKIADNIIDSVKEKKPDVVLLCDDEATNALMPKLMKNRIPTLTTGINQLSGLEWKTNNWSAYHAGIFEKYPVVPIIDFMSKLDVKFKTISILTSKSRTSESVVRVLNKELKSKAIKDKYGITLKNIFMLNQYSDWKRVVPNINEENDAVFILVPYEIEDRNGKEVPVEEIGAFLRKNLTIPTLGIIGIHTRIGLFASISVSGENLGKQSAEQACRYFNGEPLKTIGFEDIRYYDFEINNTEASRLGIEIPTEFYEFTHFLD
ncbi:MAG: hypothetical protein GY874_09870 [Desulfobacteraceae bacterium]|nr:hypothetical protein [Desulfobacteraceae bacterium]